MLERWVRLVRMEGHGVDGVTFLNASIKAIGSGQQVYESGFIVCKPDINFRMSIANHLHFTSVQPISICDSLGTVLFRPTFSALFPFLSFRIPLE
jgi:hypothetical protein